MLRSQHVTRFIIVSLSLHLLFIVAVLAIVAATNFVVLGFVAFLSVDPYLPPASYGNWIGAHPRAILWTSLITVGLVAGASLYRMATLSSGGSAVARSLGGTLIDAGTRDPLRRSAARRASAGMTGEKLLPLV